MLRAIVFVDSGGCLGRGMPQPKSLQPPRTTKRTSKRTTKMSATATTPIDITETPEVTIVRKKTKRKAPGTMTPKKKKSKMTDKMKALYDLHTKKMYELTKLKKQMDELEEAERNRSKQKKLFDLYDLSTGKQNKFYEKSLSLVYENILPELPEKGKVTLVAIESGVLWLIDQEGTRVQILDTVVDGIITLLFGSRNLYISRGDWEKLNSRQQRAVCMSPKFKGLKIFLEENDDVDEEEHDTDLSPEDNREIEALFVSDEEEGYQCTSPQSDSDSDSETEEEEVL